jgi:hypothetical protein
VRLAGHLACKGDKRNTYSVLFGGKAGRKETIRKTKTHMDEYY